MQSLEVSGAVVRRQTVNPFPGKAGTENRNKKNSDDWGPCSHGVARPQVAGGGTASNMECSCEYIEEAVADSQKGVILQLGGWARC